MYRFNLSFLLSKACRVEIGMPKFHGFSWASMTEESNVHDSVRKGREKKRLYEK